MTQVETVAVWAGLIVGLMGTALAIVAIWFSYSVNKRSEEVNTTISVSLQKIESLAERLSSDNRELIRVGWESMLPNRGESTESSQSPGVSSSELGGLLGELSAIVASGHTDPQEALETNIARWKAARHASSWPTTRPETPVPLVDRERQLLSELPDEAKALAYFLRSAHLDWDEFEVIQGDATLGPVLDSLRGVGLLVPLSGVGPLGDDDLVYWFPPGRSRAVQGALALMGDDIPEAIMLDVRDRLRNAGYPAER